ncbi:hypothetical protein FF098_000740 [Parvularcula flava]|uniref:Glycoside hydrolase family 65 n=1 Tax=Aquisalinus luteolus TaxID=1566827 RepID=A0ABX0HJ59_9PROT|nr:hypothetical protein [Aquisalinus luteolus]
MDRQALVSRHDVTLDRIDPESPVMVGNGSLAMALDITGLQTFRDEYSAFSPLMTQAQWAWHSFPNPEGYTLEDTYRPIEAHGETYQYPYFNDWAVADENPAIAYMRRNPHRISLGRLSFVTANGEGVAPLDFSEVGNTSQTLDLWHGQADSSFEIDGQPVSVTTSAHRNRDMVLVEITSPLVASGDLGVEIAFPYVSQSLQPDPAEWNADDSHQTALEMAGDNTALFRRSLDEMTYVARATYDDGSTLRETGAHRYVLQAEGETDTLRLLLEYAPEESALETAIEFDTANRGAAQSWAAYWQQGGMVDFSGSTDPRAEELERRVVLSQYLTGVNTGGDFIPQEEGLYSNSWNGKFHHEMHGWHVAHFLLWNRDQQVAASLDWYNRTLDKAQARAEHYGRDGAWWPKMTADDAVESPSTINPFIMWQQPHPIYLAELAWRNDQSADLLEQYSEVVFETADLLATFLVWDDEKGAYVLGPPVIPVQEAYDAGTTVNPTFEVAYFAWGLETAQVWRERLGMERNAEWDEVLEGLSPLPTADGLYLPVDDMPDFWADAMRPQCAGGQGTVGGVDAAGDDPADHDCLNRDHPSFLMATGLIPGGERVDDDMMRRTMMVMDEHWDFRQTWGWDFPMMAMTAARLGETEKALDYLMMDAANNQYGLTGMTPRYHLGDDGYVKNADTYFPSNGSLLAAVALMVAGWDGAEAETPGFPDDGSWVIRYEDITPLP